MSLVREVDQELDLEVDVDLALDRGQPLLDAIGRLLAFDPPPGRLLCLGLRLADFGPADWALTLDALCADPRLGVSASEVRQAHRFVHAADGVRHLLGRSLLRHWLRRLSVATPPDVLPLNPWGKPEWPAAGWQFNLSHSGSDVWLALCHGAHVGIDVETGQPEFDDLATSIHPAERVALAAGAKGPTLRRFWARKEAVIKAVGQGLSMPLDVFEVATGDGASGWLLRPPPSGPQDWTCVDLHDLDDLGSATVAVAAVGVKRPVVVRLVRLRLPIAQGPVA